MKDLNGKAHKEPQFQRKILTDLGDLESVERHWLASILAGIIVGAIDVALFLQLILEIFNRQSAVFQPVSLVVAFVANVVLLVMSVLAFAEYFSLSLSFRLNVGRGMVIRKRTGRQRSDGDSGV